jgi:hypothetical protein
MKNKKKQTPLQSIPYIGPAIEQDFLDLGIKCVEDLKGKNPEKLYEISNKQAGCILDRCLLYTYRYAVYYAEGGKDRTKLVWWAWNDNKKKK